MENDKKCEDGCEVRDSVKRVFEKMFKAGESSKFLDSEEGRQLIQDTRDAMFKEHPYEYRESAEGDKFKSILESVQKECEELDKEISAKRLMIANLEESVESMTNKLADLTSVESTMLWLYEELYDTDHKAKAIQSVLHNQKNERENLVLRYHRLSKSECFNRSNGVIKLKGVGLQLPHKCPTCGKGFRHAGDLDRHLATNCEYTGNDAYQADYLERKHIRDCTCLICGYVSKTATGLKTHHRKHERKNHG